MGRRKILLKRICSICVSTTTTKSTRGYYNWYVNRSIGSDFYPILCQKCYHRLFAYPKYMKKNPDKVKERRSKQPKTKTTFLGKRLCLSFRQKTGRCSKCLNNEFDGSCKKTDMHHYFYVPIMPWVCRIELCFSCHSKVTYNLRKK